MTPAAGKFNVCHPSLTLHSVLNIKEGNTAEETAQRRHLSDYGDALSPIVSYYFDNDSIPTDYTLDETLGTYCTRRASNKECDVGNGDGCAMLNKAGFNFEAEDELVNLTHDGTTSETTSQDGPQDAEKKKELLKETIKDKSNTLDLKGHNDEELEEHPRRASSSNGSTESSNLESTDDSFILEFQAKSRDDDTHSPPSKRLKNGKSSEEIPDTSNRCYFVESFERSSSTDVSRNGSTTDHNNNTTWTPPTIKSMKATFKALSKIFNNSKLYVTINHPGPHFSYNYRYRTTAMIPNPASFHFSRLENPRVKRIHRIMRNDGIWQNRDIGDGVDFNILINKGGSRVVRVPSKYWQVEKECNVAGKDEVDNTWRKLIRSFTLRLLKIKEIDDTKEFRFRKCWKFEECKPVLVVPKLNRLNDLGVWKFKAILDVSGGRSMSVGKNSVVRIKMYDKVDSIGELLLSEHHGIVFDEDEGEENKQRVVKKASKELRNKLTLFSNEFYNKMYHNQFKIRQIEKEVNDEFIKFIELITAAYFNHFTASEEENSLNYVTIYQCFIRSTPVDFGYLFLSIMNIPYTNGRRKINSVNYIHSCFQQDSDYKIIYVLIMLCYLQSHDVQGFILRSLLFRVDLQTQEPVQDSHQVVDKAIALISAAQRR
jgi:hypothetical protein